MKEKKPIKKGKKQTVLRAKIIHKDGSIEDLGIIAKGDAIKHEIKVTKNG